MKEEIAKLIEECATYRDTTVSENKMVAILRGGEEREALSVVKELVARNCPCSIRVARRVLGRREIVREFFLLMFPGIGAGAIRVLLEFGLVKLGSRGLVETLVCSAVEYPVEAQKALYWLPILLPERDHMLIAQVRAVVPEPPGLK